jgi:hypothetical protein
MKFFLNLAMVFYSIIANASEPKAISCAKDCNTTFGTFVGQSFLTKAYSNCSGNCIKYENNYTLVKNQPHQILTGMKWQCVEYARRWLVENKHITFADVEYAYHIWDLKHGEKIDTHEHVPMVKFKNKTSKKPPQLGDLLIYSTELAITGHVAVVVGIENDSILIAEQNYFNRVWDGKEYARRLLMDNDGEGRYRIVDEALIGWVRFAS